MWSGMKRDNKRQELHVLDVKHVYNKNNTSQFDIRTTTTSDCPNLPPSSCTSDLRSPQKKKSKGLQSKECGSQSTGSQRPLHLQGYVACRGNAVQSKNMLVAPSCMNHTLWCAVAGTPYVRRFVLSNTGELDWHQDSNPQHWGHVFVTITPSFSPEEVGETDDKFENCFHWKTREILNLKRELFRRKLFFTCLQISLVYVSSKDVLRRCGQSGEYQSNAPVTQTLPESFLELDPLDPITSVGNTRAQHKRRESQLECFPSIMRFV
ncbi:hypothetical protein TNCV_2131381 [Trichonephila clavipes]|nr:hypothetical protein TNCV_2131381 [Trichonephila clavipes]